MRIATVFSGIGAPEYAARRLFGAENVQIVFACDCGECRIPPDKKPDDKDPLYEEEVKHISSIQDSTKRQEAVKETYLKRRKIHWVKETYVENYGIPESAWHDDIRFVDGTKYRGEVDLFVGGSPCQSFSQMGHRGGLEDARGTLFYSFAKLIRDIQPKAFIFENVPGMLVHDKGNTWKTILSIFNSLNYEIVFKEVLNSVDYGIPQNRRRLFVVGIRKELNARPFVAPPTKPLTTRACDYLEPYVPAKYYLKEKGFAFTTTHTARARVNQDVIRTEKKNQQFNWNGDFRFEPVEEIAGREDVLAHAYIGNYEGKTGVVRKLTPRECHNLMGFGSDFKICQNDVEAYKQSGNSIVVDVMQAIIKAIDETGALQ